VDFILLALYLYHISSKLTLTHSFSFIHSLTHPSIYLLIPKNKELLETLCTNHSLKLRTPQYGIHMEIATFLHLSFTKIIFLSFNSFIFLFTLHHNSSNVKAIPPYVDSNTSSTPVSSSYHNSKYSKSCLAPKSP